MREFPRLRIDRFWFAIASDECSLASLIGARFHGGVPVSDLASGRELEPLP